VEQSIADRFEKIVGAYPERVAVKGRDRTFTYAQLNGAANRVARAILEQRGPGEEPVAVMCEHGATIVAVILGVLKAGKFYLVLDPSLPRKRLESVVADCGGRMHRICRAQGLPGQN